MGRDAPGSSFRRADVARTAGVGIGTGTVYRHFPTRQALVEAIAEQRFLEILGFARAMCEKAASGRDAVRTHATFDDLYMLVGALATVARANIGAGTDSSTSPSRDWNPAQIRHPGNHIRPRENLFRVTPIQSPTVHRGTPGAATPGQKESKDGRGDRI
ncbi:TetR/AcrR family transcriptional regulator [Nocardia sp. IFM 10818]